MTGRHDRLTGGRTRWWRDVEVTDRLGVLLRRLRAQAGLTQEQLEARSGVSVSTIRRLETGRSGDHRLGTLNLLADALEAGPEDRRRIAALLAGARGEPAPVSPEPDSGTPRPKTLAPEPDSGTPRPKAQAPESDSGMSRPDDRVPESPSATSRPASDASESAERPLPRRSRTVRAGSSALGALAAPAAALSTEIRRRWQHEEEQRRVHDPFPLPVRWQKAPASLIDYPANVQRLPSGATARPLDLSGDVRSVTEVYRRIRSGRLVVLGRAGSGKSILTIRFVLDFLEAADFVDRVPVIFSLGSWDPTAVALRDWLIDLLMRDHPHLSGRAPGGGTLAAALIDAGVVLPVLDGFDEIAEGLRRAALEALNTTSLPLVLTSRRAEFAEAVQAVGAPLVWAAGIELTDLTLDDLAAYLPRTARPVARDDGGPDESVWKPVLQQLRAPKDPVGAPLAQVLTTPLMIVLARTMYSEAPDRDPIELLDPERFPDANALEDHLLAGFVPTVYRRHAAERGVVGRRSGERNRDPEEAERWLGYLAHHLARLDRDQQDLAWWRIGDSLRLSTRLLTVVVTSALCVTVAEWLVTLLTPSFVVGEALLLGSSMGVVAGLAFGCVHGILVSLGGGVFAPSRVRLRMPGTAAGLARRPGRTFAARFGAVLPGGFVMGVGCACALAVQRQVYHGIPLTNGLVIRGTLINMLVLGLIFAAGAGLVFGLTAALEAPLDVASAATPVSLLASNRATVVRQVLVLVPALTLAIAVGGRLITGLLSKILGPMGWGLADGLAIGAVGGLGGGLSYVLSFTAWGRWAVLSRIWLPLTGKLPWDTVAFLDDAYRRGVLRQTGAVYQFRHIRLQHHLGRTYRERRAEYAPARFGRGA
ncbi:helix-turn-helix domain-containing protein [Streptomyces sp. NPDC056061]|uniref:helix-turn-helix domain-containing protein n=1 Tax=Streptomyces sp. NPDC056061 TaxID=3345700 RepID=UPI0035DCA946